MITDEQSRKQAELENLWEVGSGYARTPQMIANEKSKKQAALENSWDIDRAYKRNNPPKKQKTAASNPQSETRARIVPTYNPYKIKQNVQQKKLQDAWDSEYESTMPGWHEYRGDSIESLERRLKKVQTDLTQKRLKNMGYSRVGNVAAYPELHRQYEQDAQKERDLKREFNDVENYLNEQKEKKYYTDLYNNRTKLESVSNSPDWQSMTNAGQNKKIDGWFIGSGERAVKYLTDDEYKFRSNLAASAGAAENIEFSRLDKLTDDEKNIILYYAGKNDFDSVEKYLNVLERTLNKRVQDARSEHTKQMAEDHPILGTATNVIASGATPINWIYNNSQIIRNKFSDEYIPIDINSHWFSSGHTVHDTQEGVCKFAYNKAGGGEKGETAASVANMGLNILQDGSKLILGLGPALVYTGASTAGQSTFESLNNGATPEQAGLKGTADGLLEIVAGKIPMDNLRKLAKVSPNFLKQMVKGVLKQVGINATEGMVLQVVNNITDTAIMGENSQYKQYERSYIEKGFTPEEASQKAMWELYNNVKKAGVEGAVYGLFTGAGVQALAYKRGRNNNSAIIKNDDFVKGLNGIDDGNTPAVSKPMQPPTEKEIQFGEGLREGVDSGHQSGYHGSKNYDAGAGTNFKTGSFDELPSNAKNSYKGYEGNGWNGNFYGQTPGTKAGRKFNNDFGDLPEVDSMGNRITYKEFDVNNRIPGSGRDAERFVIGSDGSIYYTDSHYGQGISPKGLPPFIRLK